MNDFLNQSTIWKQKFIHEMKLYFTYAFFLALLLSVFVTYERLLLKEYVNLTFHYGYSLIEALILAKVIIIGESLKLGERYADHRPLIYPVCYKTILFCLLLFVFEIAEHVISKLLLGKQLTDINQIVTLNIINVMLAKTLVMVFIFFLFFSFLELGRFLGEGELFKIFFRKNEF